MCRSLDQTDDLLHLRRRRMEEVIFLAQDSGRALVEPFYLYGARNWTWFERHPHARDFSPGILGIVAEPLGDYFELGPISALLPAPIIPLPSFVSSSGGVLDLIIRFFGSGGAEDCQAAGAAVDAYGQDWVGRQLVCLDVRALASLDPLWRLLRDRQYRSVGLHLLPPKLVELRYPAWRDSAPRSAVRRRPPVAAAARAMAA